MQCWAAAQKYAAAPTQPISFATSAPLSVALPSSAASGELMKYEVCFQFLCELETHSPIGGVQRTASAQLRT